jgi:sugar O-acyltransferase (sialic acid O-acetyltransferase NeuD family)
MPINPDRQPVVVYGASRQGLVILQTLRCGTEYLVTGFLDDDPQKIGQTLQGLPVFGGAAWATQNAGHGFGVIVAIGSNDARPLIGERMSSLGFPLVNAVHPGAQVMPGCTLGAGIFIAAGAVIVTGTVIEDHVVINTAASIDHDSRLMKGCQVASGVHTAGAVSIGRGAFIGVGAVLGPSVSIGAGAIVGAGALVLSDIPADTLAFGSPARPVRPVDRPVDWRRLLAGR